MAARKTEAVLRNLGQRIQELRREKGHTQESLAGQLAMLAPNYARIEQGRANVTIDTLVRIANALDVELRDMFERPRGQRPRPGRPRRT
jgi:transcriptional regulator with XRE-family HTH domain